MAQPHVTDYFSSKKSHNFNASKRRKLQNIREIDIASQVFPEVKTVNRKCVRIKSNAIENVETEGLNGPKKLAPVKTQTKVKTFIKTASQVSKVNDAGEDLINATGDIKNEVDNHSDKSASSHRAEITAACDDHQASAPTTPTKRAGKEESAISQKRCRKAKRKDLVINDDKTPEMAFDFSPYIKANNNTSARKRLVMKKKSYDVNKKDGVENPCSSTSVSKTETGSDDSGLNEVHSKLGTNQTKQDIEPKTKEKNIKEISDPELMKAKLAKIHNLSALKTQLSQFEKAKNKVQDTRKLKEKQLKSEEEARLMNKKAPAYERFHHLAIPVPPSLTLPYKYKLLVEIFHNVETIVSMTYKRHEICTFSKLKAAVQVLSHRVFEEKHLGQIKRVYPSAYIFRQEKGLMTMGNKVSAYQLTVDANLTDDLKGYVPTNTRNLHTLDSEGKPSFTASKLVMRKAVFHRNLIAIVKQYHKKFLENLEKPIVVPDDKLTRWHPSFQVDDVPDIVPDDIPQPPDVKKLATAKEVLEHTNNLNHKLRRAFEIVAAENESINIIKASVNTPKKDPCPSPSPSNKSELSGVSQSLLDRIRAKEAKRMEMKMIRNPQEEKRLERIGRLPEIVRIVRTFFVTQKKPALLLQDVIAKVTDSYRSSMGTVEAEEHVKLMLKLCPEWVSTVQIRSGCYMKIDKNRDITSVQNKLTKIVKQNN